MSTVEEFLAPVSEDQPCGVDVSGDVSLQQIEMALEAFARNRVMGLELKEESKPRWQEYAVVCDELFRRGKHLQVAVLLSLSWLHLEGLEGFKRGLGLIRGLVTDHWDSFYPPVEDVEERMMILENLAAPLGQEGDYCEFMAALRRVPLSRSRLGVATLEAALGDPVPGDRELLDALDPARVPGDIAMVLQDSGREHVDAVDAALEEIEGIVGELKTAVRERVGSAAPSWTPIEQNLKALRTLVAAYKTPVAEAPELETAVAGEGEGSAPVRKEGFSGGVHSKQDVTRALDEIIQFYERSSDSELAKSPVPLMAKGIRRTMDMGFREMVQIFTPNTYEVLDLIAGTHEGEGGE